MTSAFAQEERARPSWSEEVKKTEIPEAPADQDRPEMQFNIDRSALQGDMPSFQRTPKNSTPVEEPITTIPATAEQETAVADSQQPDETAIAEQPELVAVAQDTPPAPVVTAATSEPESADKRLVSLSQTPDRIAQDTSPAATAREENAPFKLVRTKTTAPLYPRQAYLNRQEGWVDLLITVGSNGMVEGVQIVAAEPRRVFERAAIRAARKWEFVPPIDSGLSDSQQGRFRVSFVMD